MRNSFTTAYAGFTLIEIIIVVVIISVITSVTLISIDVTGSQKARTFVKEMRFLMHNLSHEAILSGDPHGLQWERKSRTAVPVVYKNNQWRNISRLDTISWKDFSKVALFVDGVEIEGIAEEEDESIAVNVVGLKPRKKSRLNLPEVLFWSTGLWQPAGEIRLEIDSLPYAKIIWTAGGRTTVKYPDEALY